MVIMVTMVTSTVNIKKNAVSQKPPHEITEIVYYLAERTFNPTTLRFLLN